MSDIKEQLERKSLIPLTNLDIIKYVKLLKIPYFRGVFIRDELPKKIRRDESGVINWYWNTLNCLQNKRSTNFLL